MARMRKNIVDKKFYDGVIFVPRPPRQSNHTLLVPYCSLRFNVPRLMMPVHRLDVFVKYHFPTSRNRYLRTKVLSMCRQDKINFLRSHIAERNLAWDKSDDVRTEQVYRERNRVHALNYGRKQSWKRRVETVKARGDAYNVRRDFND